MEDSKARKILSGITVAIPIGFIILIAFSFYPWYTFFAVLVFIIILINNPKSKNKKDGISSDKYAQLKRVLDENAKTISSTKNIETAISSFDIMKDTAGKLFEIAHEDFSLKVQNYNIEKSEDLRLITKAKNEFIYSFFKYKIDVELNKTSSLTDNIMKLVQLKKSLNIARESVKYLPDNKEMQAYIKEIENNIVNINQNK